MNTDHADLEVGVSFIDDANDNLPVIYDLKWKGIVIIDATRHCWSIGIGGIAMTP